MQRGGLLAAGNVPGASSGGGVPTADGRQHVMERESGLSPAFSGGNGHVAGKESVCGGRLTLRNYDGQVGESMALAKALNKMTLLGMPVSVRIA